jgi:hypothetical protein
MGGNLVLISEGGNVELGDGTRAEKMDLTKISRSEVKTTLVELFEQLNLQYKEQFGHPLWKDTSILKDGSAFTGSTESFFNGEISDEEYVQHKQRVGDVDLTVPESEYENMETFLKSIEGEWITENVKYLGVSKNNAGDQYNTLFEMNLSDDTKINVQVDFEFVEWEDDKPTEFSKFIHNSDWNDVSKGIKGAFHKILLFAMAENISQNKNVAIVTDKGSVKKGKTVKDTIGLHSLSFKGLRQKFVPVTSDEMKAIVTGNKRNKDAKFGDDDGQLTVDGKKVFMEVPSKDSNYSKDMAGLFEIMFGAAPEGDDIKMIYSFTGLMQALGKYFSEDQIKNVFSTYAKRLFSRGAPKTERTEWQTDKETKIISLEHFNEIFPYTVDLLYNDETQQMINTFYDEYKANIKAKGYESVIREDWDEDVLNAGATYEEMGEGMDDSKENAIASFPKSKDMLEEWYWAKIIDATHNDDELEQLKDTWDSRTIHKWDRYFKSNYTNVHKSRGELNEHADTTALGNMRKAIQFGLNKEYADDPQEVFEELLALLDEYEKQPSKENGD